MFSQGENGYLAKGLRPCGTPRRPFGAAQKFLCCSGFLREAKKDGQAETGA